MGSGRLLERLRRWSSYPILDGAWCGRWRRDRGRHWSDRFPDQTLTEFSNRQIDDAVTLDGGDVMDDSRIRRRLFVAERILSTCSGQSNGRNGLAEMVEADFDDPVLEEVLDLFQHQPAKSQVWGLSGAAYDAYIARVRALAAAVLADPHAVPRCSND